ncbi:MAG TPA: YsnF/AvaK domain-containing protein [Bryobacteraceae bacterium]|jgi:uncharacterized protein (TIGR02271 family)|nr:YsnF/AvaK domain-containing protein [Bryobacteraceae bacterium]
MAYEKIVSVFDSEDQARAAARALEEEGFSAADISVLGQQTLGSSDETPRREPGFWKRLFGGDVHEHEAAVFGRSVEAGGYVLTARLPESDVPRAMKVLEAQNPVDVHERANDYGLDTETNPLPTARTAPWEDRAESAGSGTATGMGAAAAGVGAGIGNTLRGAEGNVKNAASGVTDRAERASGTVADRVGVTDRASAPRAGAGNIDEKGETLRLAEEQLNVGKRQVEAGTTRIRRFVTEKPVEATVTLHEEHADVIRRAVSDPSFLNDVDWSDQTIEVKEMSEEAVVNKTTKLAEEVVIRKEGTDRTETIRDKVRRQEVDVEHLDAGTKAATNKP